LKFTKKFKIFIISAISLISLIVLIISLFFLFNPNIIDSQLTLRVGAYENEPKIYTNDDGNVVGFFPELLEHIALKEGWEIEYIHGTWVQCLERLENNTIDIMLDVAYTDARTEKYDFTNVNALSNWGIVFKKVGSRIETLSDLDGKKVAVMAGSVHTDGAQGIKNITKNLGINCTFIELDNYYQVFEMLSGGGADVGIVNRLFGIFNIDKYNVEATSIIFNPMGLRFAFPKNASLNLYLISSLDKHLLDLIEDSNSKYYELLETYIYGFNEFRIPEWVIITIVSSIGLVALFFTTSAILKRKVKSRTAELQKAHNELEERVAERTIELQQANIRLKGLDQLKSMFLASMSHELRTPLNSIIGFTGWLLMEMEGDINEEQRKQLTMVEFSADHLLNLINDILDISKIEAGKVDLAITKFEIAEAVEDVVNSVLPLAKNKGLKLIYTVPKGIIVNSDKRRIKQVIMNLVSNAIKFSDQGNVKIEVKLLNNKDLEVIVKDNGIGIKKEDMEILFQPFQQIDMSSTKSHEGTGLGLYLSKKILELLHSEISVKSQFGKGSEFKLIIPIKFKEEV